MKKNPESMKYTDLSTHKKVVEANGIVGTEAHRMKFISEAIGDKPMAKAADVFIKADHGQK